jgi:ABC-2 type transport system permease protein
MLSVGYVHPLTQTILCVWAVGRASTAIAGEIDRGTMELLMAQPIPRGRVVLAHLCVDLLTIPILCLSVWGGTWLGSWAAGLLDNAQEGLRVDPWRFAPALAPVALLVFAVSGYTMWLSALGRSRGRVLGLAIFLTLVQFLINLIGQLWEPLSWLRPITVFYYYQPQPFILQIDWQSHLMNWIRPAVLLAVGALGYLLALWTFCRRDLPAPL